MSTVVKPEILTVMRAAQENFEKQFKTQLDALNSKLDKIISLLELKVVEKPTKKVAKKKALTLPKEA